MTGHPASLSAELSAFVARTPLDAIPAPVRMRASLLLLDSFGTAVANRDSDFVSAMRSVVERTVAPGPATVIGAPVRLVAEGAAQINSAAIHGSDLDATHVASIIHPSAIGVPVALAAAQEADTSGAEMVAAMACGMEVLIRLGLAAGGRYHILGFQPTALLGPVVAALVCGRLWQLGEERATEAAGLSTAIAAGLRSFSDDGTWGKRLITGWACRAGLHAAALVMAGYRGSTDALEKRWGLYPAFLREDIQLTTVTEGLGERWELLDTEIKRYPCSHGLHPFVESALALRSEFESIDEVTEVRCMVNREARSWWFEPEETRYRPNSYGARFSVPYTVARALSDGVLDEREFDAAAVTDPSVLALARRVRPRIDARLEGRPPVGLPGAIEISTRDGRRLTLAEAPRPGDASGFVSRRFRAAVAPIVGLEEAASVEERLLGVSSSPTVRDLGVRLTGSEEMFA